MMVVAVEDVEVMRVVEDFEQIYAFPPGNGNLYLCILRHSTKLWMTPCTQIPEHTSVLS